MRIGRERSEATNKATPSGNFGGKGTELDIGKLCVVKQEFCCDLFFKVGKCSGCFNMLMRIILRRTI